MEKTKFSEDIQNLLDTVWKDKDMYSMSLDELKDFRAVVNNTREEYDLLQFGAKTLGNAAYGGCANPGMYFFNTELAGDITGECRATTRYMIDKVENFFRNDFWTRTDLQERFDYKLDESQHEWYNSTPIWVYSDTDSAYYQFGPLFKAMTPEYKEKYSTDEAKLDWIVKFSTQFLDKQNNVWLEELYGPRHAKNVHNFELETISKTAIYLKKKKYLKKLVYKDGKFMLNHPKISGTGIEIIKSTTPSLCRKIISDLTNVLMEDYYNYERDEFVMMFNEKLNVYRRQFYDACVNDIEAVSQSVSIGDYKTYVVNDKDKLEFGLKAPVSVKAIAMYNYIAHQHGQDNLRTLSGKIKYYRIDNKNTMFGFPVGAFPEWAPKINKQEQWEKTVIDPINRFLEVMNIPLVNAAGTIQFTLF